MRAAIKSFRVRKIDAQADEVAHGVQADVVVSQSSTIGIGLGEKNVPLVKVDMQCKLIGKVSGSEKEFLRIAIDVEAVFEELDSIDIPGLQADLEKGKAFGDDCSRLVYPHAMLVLQRYLSDFGIVGAQLSLEFPRGTQGVAVQ